MATVLRLVHKTQSAKDPVWLQSILGLFLWPGLVLGLLLFTACSPSDEAAADKLNSLSYASHYRNIDSTEVYAYQALESAVASKNDDARAEALNNLAFAAIVRMNYERADSLLAQTAMLTDNQLELLVCYVQQMRLCQRRSNNRAFYEYREKASDALKRVNEEREGLSPRQLYRLVYAESEMGIVTSTYYYYVGLERQSSEAIKHINQDLVRHDTAQYLNYLYNIGSGGILTEGTATQIHHEEMDYLYRCLRIAERHGFIYFIAQAKEALAEHTDSLSLAEEALHLFQQYGDVYQIAGAYRTLASCYHAKGNDREALRHLHLALADSTINQAPDLVASIYEQLSVAYAAINDKPQSDYNRNLYLDLQEQTRQDRELEARAGLLDQAVTQLNWMITAVIGSIVLLCFLLWLFNHQNKRKKDSHELDDQLEEKQEELHEARLRVENNERHYLEQRAKVSLAMSILPLIDRIRHEVTHLEHMDKQQYEESLSYIRELTDNINEQNDLLTQWIQLRQGDLNLHIESFPLQPLFELISRSRRTFAMKGVTLDVKPVNATVKADRVLTLFMLNTLADNARKFTPKEGHVTISAQEASDYVEISVSDTGCGMSEQQLAHVFDHKPLLNEQGHGFGLMNCKGIIEKYRKVSRIFSVCCLQAESHPGEGSRFYFRLPKGIVRLLVIGYSLIALGQPLMANNPYDATLSEREQPTASSPLAQAHIFADSAYFCNINGNYARTLQFADSCRQYLNAHYLAQQPDGKLLMSREDNKAIPSEIQWFHNAIDTNYEIILDIRNESAVAALALHDWSLYDYNNKVYTQLFKEMSADNTLEDYCRAMQQSHTNKRVAVILLLVLLVMIAPAYYILYYRHRLYEHSRREHKQQTDIEMTEDELRRAELENANLHVVNNVLDNCLSTLKHETMYYPSRIQQLLENNDTKSLTEVSTYYRDLYAILIQQAADQLEHIPLRLHPIQLYGQKILGDENLLHYLFELLEVKDVKSEATDMVKSDVKDDKYVVFHIPLTSALSPLTTLLCRQIVRDHAEAANRHGCGITKDHQQVNITLPRYNGKL